MQYYSKFIRLFDILQLRYSIFDWKRILHFLTCMINFARSSTKCITYIYIYIDEFFLAVYHENVPVALIFPKEIIYPHQIVQKNDLFVPRHGLSALEKYIISLIVSWLYFHFVVYQYRWHDTVSLISFPTFLPTTGNAVQHFASF